MSKTPALLTEMYQAMLAHFGRRNWWPGETALEMCVGAILTQNTNWGNVEKAIARLKAAGALTPGAIAAMPADRLGELIRPAGYYNITARRLKNLIDWMVRDYGGDVQRMTAVPMTAMREQLLAVNGIGPETADSILLYALDKPIFVIDAYTRRVFARLDLTSPQAGYTELQEYFTQRLPRKIALYNDYHAQVVALGNRYCRAKPACELCPLKPLGRCRAG
jgi:endonuclease III related protein